MMSEKRFILAEDRNGLKSIFDNEIENGKPILVNCIGEVGKVVDLLNEQEQKIQRWKNLYELKDAEVTARVDTLNRVCNYYLEVQFIADVDPNEAVKEVINEILNAPIYEE